MPFFFLVTRLKLLTVNNIIIEPTLSVKPKFRNCIARFKLNLKILNSVCVYWNFKLVFVCTNHYANKNIFKLPRIFFILQKDLGFENYDLFMLITSSVCFHAQLQYLQF